ncbi:MAG: hypothetical protein HOO91_03505 [Bacteroidales bacterium]|nr:hypothetical protein [Bacteroidales bacterium]
MKRIEPTEWQLKQWHDDPKNWKLGIFYYNRMDRRLFPPKRFYGGWTVNFANPISMVALLVLLILIIAIKYSIQ